MYVSGGIRIRYLSHCKLAPSSTRPRLLQMESCEKLYLQTAAIFFLSKLYLKQGIGSVYVMVDFICKGYLEL